MKPVKMQKIIREIQKNLKLSTDVTVVTISSVFPCEPGEKDSIGKLQQEGSYQQRVATSCPHLPTKRICLSLGWI